MNYLPKKLTDLFHMDWSAVNLAKPTVGMAIVLVALILLLFDVIR